MKIVTAMVVSAAVASAASAAAPETWILAKAPDFWTTPVHMLAKVDRTGTIYETYRLVTAPKGYSSIGVGRFEGSYGIDVVVTTLAGRLKLIRYWGNGMKVEEKLYGPVPSGYTEIKGVVDFDGDSLSEAVLVNPSTSMVAAVELRQDGSSETIFIENNMMEPGFTRLVGVADMDNQPGPDLVYENPETHHLFFQYVWNGAVYWNSLGSYDPDPHPLDPNLNFNSDYLGFADVNGDGFADCITNPPNDRFSRVWFMMGFTLLQNSRLTGPYEGFRRWTLLTVSNVQP